jgi:hypothetical protein
MSCFQRSWISAAVPHLWRSLVALVLLIVVTSCRSSSSTSQTYALSASVSGLTGSGLVVTTNGADVAVASGTRTQLLAGSLADGANYSVTIKSQPAGQTCSIAGGTGVIHAANAANVVVTCSNQAYRLGGSVTGLTTSGLVLANGSDIVSVSSEDTAFQFPAAVAYSSSYAVTVATQPAGQACAVSTGSGTMPAATVDTVAVSCTDEPFTLSGTVSNSPGVTLANGSDTLLVPSASGISPFTMAHAVPYGSTYDLTVGNVAAGHTCTVTNGAGTMGAANVTGLAVTCATKAYTIGGSLSGVVSGDSLVLVNTNGDHTTIDPAQSSFDPRRHRRYW